MKRNRFIVLLVCLLLAASCKPSRESSILGLWQETGIKNPQMAEAFDQQSIFADTVGRSTDSLTNITLYGAVSMDSFRKNLRANMDSFRRAQAKAVSETWFEFHKNGIAYLHSQEGLDSARWSFEEDGALMLDEEALKGGGAKIRMEVTALNDSELRLEYSEKYLSSIANFRKVKR